MSMPSVISLFLLSPKQDRVTIDSQQGEHVNARICFIFSVLTPASQNR